MSVLVRLFDLIASSVLLILAAPLFAGVAVLIKLDSSGPVFFLQERVGRNWRRFKMFKFRKMHRSCSRDGTGITSRFDPRVTRVGSWLERTKLDELPQLINVLLGQMSLVGPRPELLKFTGEPHRELWNEVLSVRPGIFGPNQITHRNESELFPEDCEDVEAYYVRQILPDKLKRDAEYAHRKSLFYDVGLILRGLWASVAGTITKDSIRARRWQVTYLLGCVLLGELTLIAAFFLRFNWRVPPDELRHLTYGLVLMSIARLLTFFEFRIHRSVHAFFSLSDALRICTSVAVGTVFGIAAQMLLNIRALSRSIFVVDGVLLAVSMIGLSYLIDRSLEALKRDRGGQVNSLSSYALWSAAGGVAGVVSMLYALVVVWPGVLAERWSYLANILAGAFLVRVILLPFLVRRLPRSYNFVTTVTQETRAIIGHLALVFVADITMAFFLDIRDFSRGAVLVNAVFYCPLLIFVLAVRCAWNRKYRELPAEGVKATGRKDERLLVVGDGRETGLLVSAIKHARDGGMEVVGVVTGNLDNRTHHVEGVEVLGTTKNLPAVLKAREPSLVIVLKNTISFSAVRAVLRACRKAEVDIRFVPSIMQLVAPSNGGEKRRKARTPELEASGIEVR